MPNVDRATVEGFGHEWSTFDYGAGATPEIVRQFERYFAVFPWTSLPTNAVGADFGCGSGRWARLVAPRVNRLYCVDASAAALDVARRNLAEQSNVDFVAHPIDTAMPIADGSLDFAYSLGVLHHIPDTAAALADCVTKLKPGAPMLLYLYYALDNRPTWFRAVWRASDLVRRRISQLPFAVRRRVTDAIALAVYWPLSRTAALLERLGIAPTHVPLASYRDKSVYVLRTDALDRFGTQLEQRFSRAEIERMMRAAGLEQIEFSDEEPYWCAVGRRAR